MQLWAIQTKLVQEDSTKFLVDAFQRLGLNWAAFPVRPFDDRLPDFGWEEGPIVYYGSTALIRRVLASRYDRARARLFFDAEKHCPSWYGPLLGEAWLNHGAKRWYVSGLTSDLRYTSYPDDVRLFVRPDSGLKSFAGHVADFRSIRDTLDRHLRDGNLVFGDTVWLNAPINIEREYRNWIVGDAVVATVGYRRNGRVDPWDPRGEPETYDVRRFAREQASKLSGLEAYVLDVAVLPDGSLRVVEINGIHTSGFYLTSVIYDVVAVLSNYIAMYPKGPA